LAPPAAAQSIREDNAMLVTAGKPRPSTIPPRGGVGLKAQHYRTIIESEPENGFSEVHAENYMGAGGPPHRYLTAIRERYPLSLHGVGLSIGADRQLDRDHLQRLRVLIERYEPGLFSEHLAWSTHDSGFLSDLLPVPYTAETLARVCEHIDQVQEVVGRQMLLENPTTYLNIRPHFGLRIAVVGQFDSSLFGFGNQAAAVQHDLVRSTEEIHLAGYTPEADEKGRPLLIDTHDRPVDTVVWDLFASAIKLTGPVPTLIEWDADVPAWGELHAEARRAETIMAACCNEGVAHAPLS
jgi:uncharacterized protein (UPF0276 family)